MKKARRHKRRFRMWLNASIIFTYLVILAGGIVRTTGSGMGCPDWPRCFGKWIPPTEASELQTDYKEHYIEVRKDKNEKLAAMLVSLGFSNLADKISNDPSIYEETDFVWQRTWTEYVNRLTGAMLGLVLLVTFFSSMFYWKKRRKIPLLILAIILVTGFQGWMGSVVVSTNLLPGILTMHMLLAFVIIFGLIYVHVISSAGKRITSIFKLSNTTRYALGLLTVLTLIQVFFGTQVRQQIDEIAKDMQLEGRANWIASLNWKFAFHRSFSLLILVGNAWLCYQIIKYLNHYFAVYRVAIYLAIFIGLEVLTGIVMAYFNVPRWAQPLHLVLSCLIFGAQVYLFLVLGSSRRIQNPN